MSYSGNMPDWHQYNPPQPGGSRAGTTSHPQNVTSHHFMSSITPPALDGINLTTDRPQKRNDSYPRGYQSSGISQNCPTSSSLATSAVHMSPNCHYNRPGHQMIEQMDPRLTMNDTDMHRSNQMPFNPPSSHSNNLSVNPSLGGIPSQNSPVAPPPLSPGSRQTCRLPCCDPTINYPHWEKYQHYQTNSTYRENISRPTYPLENRRFVPEMNLRKECVENKEIPTTFDHRNHPNHRNYDYKYRKEVPRSYPSTILPNYPIQNYNFPSDCQKCPHTVKDYMRRSATSSTIPPQNPALMKYPEQPHAQRHNSKLNYQNGTHQAPIPGATSTSIPSSMQSSYFNPPMPREPTREPFAREFQEPNSVNRLQPSNSQMMHSGYQKYHVYQQKIAMERFSLENHLRGMARMPGYQSHPKYQECVMRYRELLRLQQNIDCQSFLQEAPKIPPTSPNAPVAPINLQFDQNGCLINSNYPHFPGIHNSVNPPTNPETDTSPQVQGSAINPLENSYKQPEQLNLPRDERLHHIRNEIPRHFQLPKNPGENFDNMIVDVDSIDPTRSLTSCAETMLTTTAASDSNGKEFADKPQLDVRQFLANWDETEEEEGGGGGVGNSNTPERSSVVTNASEHTDTSGPSPNQPVESPHNAGNSPKAIVQSTNQVIEVAESVIQPLESIQLDQAVESAASIVEKADVSSLKAIEEFTTTGTIVQCIQTDSNDIPTIHIVDHLPEDSELATIQTVYGDVTSLSIEQIATAPIEIINDAQEPSETIALFGQDTGVCSKEPECSNEAEDASAVVEEVASLESASTASKSPDKLSTVSNNSPVPMQELLPPPQEPDIAKNQSESTTLRKQHSFTSEELHNPDDISFPDLPMSECTPISTTLNTPIHSDSEESSHVTDLPANPIEIVQNSPIISFTHSPLKMDPYSALENGRNSDKQPHESLDFDFREKKTAEVENFEIARRNSPQKSPNSQKLSSSLMKNQENGSKTQSKHESHHLLRQNSLEKLAKDAEFYPASDPLMGMNKKSKNSEMIDSSNDMTNVGDCSMNSLNANAAPGTPVSRILSTDEIDTGKCPSIIDTEDFQPTSDDLDKLCNISLDSSCMMPLISSDSQEPRLASIDGIKNVLPITNLNELDSESEDEQKDEWVAVRSMDEEVGVNDVMLGDNELAGIEIVVPSEKEISKQEKKSNRIRSIFDTSEDSQSTGFEELTRRKQEKIKESIKLHLTKDCKKDKSNADILNKSQMKTMCQKQNDTQDQHQNQNRKQNQNENQNHYQTENQSETAEKIDFPLPPLFENCCANDHYEKSGNNESPTKKDTSIEKSHRQEAQKPYTCNVTQCFRRTHKDTDVEIHVANINMEKLLDPTSEAVDAIEVKINVSRHDKKLRVKSIEKVAEKHDITKTQSYFPKIDQLPDHKFENKFDCKCDHKFDHKFENKFDQATYHPQRIFPRRRVSNPEQADSRRAKKESRRRNSSGYSYRSYRKSFEKSDKMDKINGKIGDESPKFTLPPPKPAKTPEPSCSEEPVSSSHDDSQESVPVETTNTCESQNTEEDSIFEGADSKIDKQTFSAPKASNDRLNSDFVPEFDELENLASRSSLNCQNSLPGPSSSTDFWTKLDFPLENTSTMDFDHFDVAPNSVCDVFPDDLTSSTLTEDKALSRRLEECERFRNPYSKTYENLEMDLDTVPLYTTKDGMIKYSPNPKFTYRVLIMEARQREGYPRDFQHERHLREHVRKNRKIPKNPSSDRRKHWNDYNPTRTWATSSRRRLEDPSWRINRSSKYDRWRERPPEMESDGISVESAISERILLGRKIDRFADEPRRRSSFPVDENRHVDSLMVGSIKNLSFASQSFDSKTEVAIDSRNVEARIFNGDELELFSMKMSGKGVENSEEVDNGREEQSKETTQLNNLIDDFRDNFQESEKFIEKSPLSRKLEEKSGEKLSIKFDEKPEEKCLGHLSNDFQDNFKDNLKENVEENFTQGFEENLRESFEENFTERFEENFKDNFPENFDDFNIGKEDNLQKIVANLRSELSDEDSKDPKDGVMNSMRPPPSVDIEQDSQAMLTDSGLESSTTYTEGHKEPRRCSIWHREMFCDRILTPKRITEEPLKSPKIITNVIESKKITSETDKADKRDENRKNQVITEIERIDNENFEVDQLQDVDKNLLSERLIDPTQIADINFEKGAEAPEENLENTKKSEETGQAAGKLERKFEENIAKLEKLYLPKIFLIDYHSYILKGLDLAFPSRKMSKLKRSEKPTIIIDEASTRENATDVGQNLPESFDILEHQSTSLGLSKRPDVPCRRASSDEVEKRISKLSFFEQNLQFPKILNKSFLPEIKSVGKSVEIFVTKSKESFDEKSTKIFGEKSAEILDGKLEEKPIEIFSEKSSEKTVGIFGEKLGEKLAEKRVKKSVRKTSEKSVEKCVERLLGKFLRKSVENIVQPYIPEESTTETREIPLPTENGENTSALPEGDTSQTVEHCFEKPEVPKLLPSKSLPRKIVIETPEPSTESETSQFDETLSSTQFGSEYAASKPGDCSSGVNFLSTSSQEAIDATDLKKVRKNLALCALEDETETTKAQPTKIAPPKKIEEGDRILRFSSESEDDSNAQDGSPMVKNFEGDEDLSKTNEGEEKLLSFSGKIHSPEAVQESNDRLPICHPLVSDFPAENYFEKSQENSSRKSPEKLLIEKLKEHFPMKLNENSSENFIKKSPRKSPAISPEKLPEKQEENLLTFSGKIPSPKNIVNEFDTLSPKNNESDEKHLTFTGKIQSENPRKSTIPFEKIPKFIIKKTDCSSRSSSISQIFPSEVSSQRSLEASSSHRISHPKIPKMIIRNVRSRPGTPTIEENAVELSFPKTDNDQRVFEVKIKLDEKAAGSSSMRKSLGVIECKVPKMKIKLEDKHSKMTFENASMELPSNSTESLKNVPKVKIRKIRRTMNEDRKTDATDKIDRRMDKFLETSMESSFSETAKSFEKIPILKIRKTEQRIVAPASHSESSRRKRTRSPENSSKKLKKSKKLIVDLDTTSSTTCLSEKIPKVIIKRASSTSEFKCELSKDGGIMIDSKWQPEVKLERHKVLDTIAKEQGSSRLPADLLESIMKSFVMDKRSRRSRKLQRTSSDPTRSSVDTDKFSSRGRRRYSDAGKPQIDDSDIDDAPRAPRRHFIRRVKDESSLGLMSDSKTEFSETVTSKTGAKSMDDLTRSDLEYSMVVSSQKKSKVEAEEEVEMEAEQESVNLKHSGNLSKLADDVGEQSVIKLESSDESQTTIELLPASSDISQPESEVPTPLEGERQIANGDMARLYSSDAIPTQFELELEIVDNSSGSLEVPVPEVRNSPSNRQEPWGYHPQAKPAVPPSSGPSFGLEEIGKETDEINKSFVKIADSSKKMDKNSLKNYENSVKTSKKLTENGANLRNFEISRKRDEILQEIHGNPSEIVNIEAKSICSSDSLVKDVLAAKETLKRYLSASKVTSSVPRTKTPAEKKQFSVFEFAGSSKNGKNEKIARLGFQEETAASSSDVSRAESSKYDHLRKEKKEKARKRLDSTSISDEKSRRDRNSNRESTPTVVKRHRSSSESNESNSKRMRPPSTSGSSGKSAPNQESTPKAESSLADGGHKLQRSLKLSRPLERREGKDDKKRNAKVMPILEPEGGIPFQPSSRDTSRSPPMITKQESSEMELESQKKVDQQVSAKMEGIIDQESDGMTFADIVTKMAYHEKATIKHKRYCILCERWFPTTARHRRHLSGYQHRHTELTQRRTVHALFMLFTGKPCPRLLPASIVRTDCAPGEPTPLQIAVQDVAISLENGAIDKAKQINEDT